MKILIAEDEPIMLKTMELKLKRDGHEVITANNGRDAIQLFTDNQVDLVITDIMMPYTSGLEILGFVKKNRREKDPGDCTVCHGPGERSGGSIQPWGR